MSLFITIRLTFCAYLYFITYGYAPSVSSSTLNSTGQYYTVSNTTHFNVECNHPQFCYLQCDHCESFTFIANSTSTMIYCSNCDDLTIYAEYSQNFTMYFNDSRNGQIHIQHADNVEITYINVEHSQIYAQYAQRFTFQPLDFGNDANIFYLDHVSDFIHFQCSESINCGLKHSTIIASNANYFSFILPTNISSIYQFSAFYTNYIYCPSHAANVCVLDALLLEYSDIYIVNVSGLNVLISQQSQSKYYSYYYSMNFDIHCNDYSMTKVDLDGNEGDVITKCINQLSECCYSTNYANRTDIVCDSEDDVCSINCNQNETCNGSNIIPSNTTMFLEVICEDHHFCEETIILCPNNSHSVCNIWCMDYDSCSNAQINYNTNNEYMNLHCERSACHYLEVFINSAESMDEVTNIANFHCDYYGCRDAVFKVNAEIDMLNISCLEDGCDQTIVHAELAENLQINCLDDHACWLMNVYGQSDKMNAIQLNCKNGGCDDMNIFSELQYELDYLFLIGEDLVPDLRISCLSHNQRSYNIPFFCDPFRDSWNGVVYCNDGDQCNYNLNDETKMIIYANNADLLSISCRNCSEINIFAINAAEVNIECIYRCKDIRLNGKNVDIVNFQCYGFCGDLMIDVEFAKNILINVESLISSEIIALQNENVFDLICNTECNKLDLFVSSTATSSVTCNGDNVCQTMKIYSNNGEWNDIKNLKIVSCDNTTYKTEDNWYLFCLSSVIWFADRWNNDYKYIDVLDATYYKCGNSNNQELINSVGGIIEFDPFSSECVGNINVSELRLFHQIVSVSVCIILFGILCFWFIILIKNLILKYIFPKKYNFKTNIEPPSLYLLKFMYLNDIFIWMIQIYLLIICWNIYMQYNDRCTSIPVDPEGIDLCNLRSFCEVNNNLCGPVSVFHSCFIITFVALCVGFAASCCSFCAASYSEVNGNDYDIGLPSHCAVTMSCYPYLIGTSWHHIVETDYLQRRFWSISKLFVGFYLIRYILFFVAPLIIYFMLYNEDDIDVNFKWYDIFPVLLVLIVNEIIKQRYRKFLPYNKIKHLQYILDDYFGDAISSIIISFLGDERSNMLIMSPSSLLHRASNKSVPIEDDERISDTETEENDISDVEIELVH